MRLRLWPQSLFGRLIAATVAGVLLAQAAGLYLLARNNERFVTQVTTRMWAHRISEITLLLRQLPASQRTALLNHLIAAGVGPGGPRRFRRRLAVAVRLPHQQVLERLGRPRPPRFGPWRRLASRRPMPPALFIRLPFATHARARLVRRVRAQLGSGYRVTLAAAKLSDTHVIRFSPLFMGPLAHPRAFFDVHVSSPGQPELVFRLARLDPRVALSPRLMLNMTLLVAVLVIALYVATRGITRPLSRLSRAAETIGRGGRVPPLPEQGARELRDAARVFNSMQERLHRYLDSRTGVLAAMSHDLKTPLTRLRLQVETLIDDVALRARLGRELDEMEGMVRGALALFRGVDEHEPIEPIDIDALTESVRRGFEEMGHEVSVTGRSSGAYPGRPQALKRCVTNLVSNAVKFGGRAHIEVHDGAALRIAVHDEGPGIPPQSLERVFEPFFRLESSRNRDTGGTGLGLSIARDVAQAHGGTLRLRNRPQGGLEAELCLPRLGR